MRQSPPGTGVGFLFITCIYDAAMDDKISQSEADQLGCWIAAYTDEHGNEIRARVTAVGPSLPVEIPLGCKRLRIRNFRILRSDPEA